MMRIVQVLASFAFVAPAAGADKCFELQAANDHVGCEDSMDCQFCRCPGETPLTPRLACLPKTAEVPRSCSCRQFNQRGYWA